MLGYYLESHIEANIGRQDYKKSSPQEKTNTETSIRDHLSSESIRKYLGH